MKRLQIRLLAAIGMVGVGGGANADELTDMLAPQYIYMELCKDSPPLPADRLRTIDKVTDMVDKQELNKSVIRMMFKLKLADGDKAKVANFCSTMATMIENEPGHEK
jgi:hypothetical protein